MDKSLFSQAVDDLFVHADEQIRDDTIEKVTVPIYEFIKRQLSENGKACLDTLNKQLLTNFHSNEVLMYKNKNTSYQLSSLSEDVQQAIFQSANQELIILMHKIYFSS
jgi:hypothetical protein